MVEKPTPPEPAARLADTPAEGLRLLARLIARAHLRAGLKGDRGREVCASEVVREARENKSGPKK